ncbi:hypothetical protein A1O1_02009 [Capronia coronata CBS 617.96]|uniref:Conidiation protein 6 n=1 Tax=Capronia coronata CBS 617.96 TaxID=1182541 RepID=W9YL23_9EURO|nr:uncharacterized protein A1O1_02009 [Capronia coronata CBS 617.96]EXJ93617.1 hypothetical protein A1O1_02009 [Capronia coronata CBS 617.96]
MAEEASNKARGYKSTLSNPNTSDEAKQHAKEVLDNELNGGDVPLSDEGDKDPKNVARGLKAATHNPNVSEEGKKAAQEKLDSM